LVGKGLFLKSSGKLLITTKTNRKINRSLLFFFMLSVFVVFACSHSGEDFLAANDFFSKGNYEASLGKYEELIQEDPDNADWAFFEMGIIYAHPENPRKSYPKALDCFRKIVNEYPHSPYRRDSQMMVLQIQNVSIKDHLIAEQQTQMDDYRRTIKSQENEIMALRKKVGTLEQKVFELRTEPVDKVLIEKKNRRLMLISKGKTIKTYKIALGGDPIGPKERRGDNKTPEGVYTIESRNRQSEFHLSLRISYPNKKDKMHAKALGVSPGGDIMIHGIKNGLAWVGGFHTEMDWTDGCIAVTNPEMEEIARLVPNGTPVEIRP
jgi:L,D-peptidoglycan transpeptidase YkuD (ErfK/YbiS/YcfS/YnhG family)